MARKAERRLLLDTSAVIYRLHGHTLQRAAIEEATADGTVEAPPSRDQRRRLRRREIDLAGDEARRRHAGNRGFLRQADVLQEADTTKDRTPNCRWCERLGDALIALQAGRGVRIVTADRTFTALGDLLGVPVVLLPSLAELKRRAAGQDAYEG
jgi:hypothetical protein